MRKQDTPSFTVFGFPTAEPLATERTSSCILCHHMHEKGAIKEHISFIPGNFPNPWWAAGERKTLWMWVSRWQRRDFVGSAWVCVFPCMHVCEHAFVWIHLHYWEDLFNDNLFYFVFLFLLVYVWEHVHVCLCVGNWIWAWHTEGSLPKEKGLRSLEVAPKD